MVSSPHGPIKSAQNRKQLKLLSGSTFSKGFPLGFRRKSQSRSLYPCPKIPRDLLLATSAFVPSAHSALATGAFSLFLQQAKHTSSAFAVPLPEKLCPPVTAWLPLPQSGVCSATPPLTGLGCPLPLPLSYFSLPLYHFVQLNIILHMYNLFFIDGVPLCRGAGLQ